MSTSKKKGNVKGVEEFLTKEDIKELTEAMVEYLSYERRKEADPFDMYVSNLRSKIYSDVKTNQDRFIRGYHALLKVFHDSY